MARGGRRLPERSEADQGRLLPDVGHHVIVKQALKLNDPGRIFRHYS